MGEASVNETIKNERVSYEKLNYEPAVVACLEEENCLAGINLNGDCRQPVRRCRTWHIVLTGFGNTALRFDKLIFF